MNRVNVEGDEQVAAFDFCAVGDVNFKVLTVKLNGIDTDMH